MSKYYNTKSDISSLSRKSGSNLVIPQRFHELSSLLISLNSSIQHLIQLVLYTSYGDNIEEAKSILKKNMSPKSRMEFVNSLPYGNNDEIISKVFDYAKFIFFEIYELRNILSHELWSSSDEHKDYVIFSTLTNEENFLIANWRVLHKENTTTIETHKSILEYIRSMKFISCKNLQEAITDANLCSWILMNISTIINETDLEKREEGRKAFLIFRGTSHLFGEVAVSSETVNLRNSKSKTILG